MKDIIKWAKNMGKDSTNGQMAVNILENG